jgi:hypothetical protein
LPLLRLGPPNIGFLQIENCSLTRMIVAKQSLPYTAGYHPTFQ